MLLDQSHHGTSESQSLKYVFAPMGRRRGVTQKLRRVWVGGGDKKALSSGRKEDARSAFFA